MTQSELARQFNVPSQSVNNWEKRGLPPAIAVEAEEKYGVSPFWLIKGIGNPFSRSVLDEDNAFIPIKNATASMGSGMVASEFEMVVDEIKVSRTWLRRELPQVSSISNLQIISAIGDSMSPTYNSGDMLLVDTGFKKIISDLIYVFSFQDEMYVKRIVIDPVARHIQIKSDNPSTTEWKPLAQERIDELIIHGRVIYAWKGFKL